MKTEIIEHHNKKIIKKIKNNADISYSLKGAYLGIDNKTGKQVTTTITAKTLKALDRKLLQAKLNFEKNANTKQKVVVINRFSDLVDIWFSNFQTWVSSQNTVNRVKGYIDTWAPLKTSQKTYKMR